MTPPASPRKPAAPDIITVTLNTAVDRVMEVPGLAIGAHARGRQVSRYPAGKAINASRAMARLGRASIATGFVGDGEFEQFENYLAGTGPGRANCQLLSVRGHTRENITLIDPVNHTDTHVRDDGFEVQAADIQRIRSKLHLLARPGSLVLFSGSLPQGMTVDDLLVMVEDVVLHGERVALDLEGEYLRKVLDQYEPVAPAAGQQDARPWLIKPNARELAGLMGRKATPDPEALITAARSLTPRVAWVALTLGCDGACLVGGGHAWRGHVPVDPERIVNTVGCGDCLVAGLLDAWADNFDPARVLARGMAVATANAIHEGVAEFTYQEVLDFERIAQVVQIS